MKIKLVTEYTELDSSQLESMRYANHDKTLSVTFKNGDQYVYSAVPTEVMIELADLFTDDNLMSIGKWFTATIKKGGYAFYKVEKKVEDSGG